MEDRIVVTATGIVSALGLGTDANLQALLGARSGLRHPKLLQTIHATEFVMGEVAQPNNDLSAALGLPAGDNGYTRTTLLALTAMKDLLKDVDIELLRSEPFALINANTVGGMCTVENMYEQFIGPDTEGDFVKYINTLDCAESTQHMAAYFGLDPLMATISTACTSSANSLLLGYRYIKHGIVKRAVCGGCDSLSRFTVNGFNSLKNVSKEPCKPFDNNRTGLNLGEGAGYIMLEKESDAKARGAHILAVFSGYCNSNDAYHPTAPSPDGSGALHTMQQALDMAGLQPSDIGYINTHGTATTSNDASEGKAIQTLFAGKVPPFSSTKPYTGHTLAATGIIEAIFSIWALQRQLAYPNLNFDTQMEELCIAPITTLTENIAMRHVLSNSFGFGGNNVSLVFSQS